MSMFEVIAYTKNGKVLRGLLEGRNANDVRALVRKSDTDGDVRRLVVARVY